MNEQLEYRLRVAFEVEPLEDGIHHPAERIIDGALESTDRQQVIVSLNKICLDTKDPGFSSTVLRCLGRRVLGTPNWRTEVVRSALAVDDVEMRDAAVQAAESWGDREMIAILESHVDAVPWLRTYIEDVVEDLKG